MNRLVKREMGNCLQKKTDTFVNTFSPTYMFKDCHFVSLIQTGLFVI